MIRGIAAIASQPGATAAAIAALEAGGSAVDAVVAGFFAAAGAEPGVLLSPCVALLAGAGAGTRVFDGRAAQPGLGVARPRGFVGDAELPRGARVAAPRSIPMLMLLHTYRGRTSLTTLAKAGVSTAEAAGAKVRAGLIRRVGASGALALRSQEVSRALLAVGGPVSGGVLSQQDLDEARPAESDAATTEISGESSVFSSPFPGPGEQRGAAEVILACDGRGVLAALAYSPSHDGLAVPELELTLGGSAVPVRRGVTRVTPGTPLPAAAPIAIFHQRGGVWAAIGLPGAVRVDPSTLATLASGAPAEAALAALCSPDTLRSPLALITDGRTARAVTAG